MYTSIHRSRANPPSLVEPGGTQHGWVNKEVTQVLTSCHSMRKLSMAHGLDWSLVEKPKLQLPNCQLQGFAA